MIPEDIKRHFVFPIFATLVPGTLRKVLDNCTTTRDKSYLNGVGTTKGESGGLSMMIITGMEVTQYDTTFNYEPLRPHKCLNPQYITIVAVPGMKQAPEFVLPGHSKRMLGMKPP